MHFYNLVTDFKTQVYKAVKKIPKGKTATYKEVAVSAGRPAAWRAVGNILNKNFNPKIPCHRIIRSDGKMGGYNRGDSKRKKLFFSKKKQFSEKKQFRRNNLLNTLVDFRIVSYSHLYGKNDTRIK